VYLCLAFVNSGNDSVLFTEWI